MIFVNRIVFAVAGNREPIAQRAFQSPEQPILLGRGIQQPERQGVRGAASQVVDASRSDREAIARHTVDHGPLRTSGHGHREERRGSEDNALKVEQRAVRRLLGAPGYRLSDLHFGPARRRGAPQRRGTGAIGVEVDEAAVVGPGRMIVVRGVRSEAAQRPAVGIDRPDVRLSIRVERVEGDPAAVRRPARRALPKPRSVRQLPRVACVGRSRPDLVSLRRHATTRTRSGGRLAQGADSSLRTRRLPRLRADGLPRTDRCPNWRETARRPADPMTAAIPDAVAPNPAISTGSGGASARDPDTPEARVDRVPVHHGLPVARPRQPGQPDDPPRQAALGPRHDVVRTQLDDDELAIEAAGA